MASMNSVLDRIKRDPLELIGRQDIDRLCDELGYDWRQRQLDPATTIGLFIQQVAHGNVPCSEVRHIAHGQFSASAYCQARTRLPLELYQRLLDDVYHAAGGTDRRCGGKWRGHRVFLIDGSGISMPDMPALQQHFGQPPVQKVGCGFPVAHVLFLFNARSGLLADAIAACWKRGDLADVPELLRHLAPGDVLVGDDYFGNYVVLALLLQQNQHGLFPIHHARVVDFTPRRPYAPEGQDNPQGLPRSRWVRSLGKDDQIVDYFKPRQRPPWMTREAFATLPASIRVRELRRTVTLGDGSRKTLLMVSTLLDAQAYPAEELAKLRGQRWDVETNIGHLKTTMKLDVLRCKSVVGIHKELCIFALVYNLVRVVMLEAARRQRVAVQRISFADTLHWLKHARPGDELPKLLVNPLRPGRFEPRVKKRRPKPYTYMCKPRHILRTTGERRKRRA